MLFKFESRFFIFAYRGGALTLGFMTAVMVGLALTQTACTDSGAQFTAATDLGITIDQPHSGATLTSGGQGANTLSIESAGTSKSLSGDTSKIRALLQQTASATMVQFVGRCDYDGQPVMLKVAKRPEIKTTCGNLTWSASVDLGPEPDGAVVASAQHWDTSGKMVQTTISLRKRFHPSLQESATISSPVPSTVTSADTAVFNIAINPGIDPSIVDLSVSKISMVYAAGGDASCKSVTLQLTNGAYGVVAANCTGNGSLTVSLTAGSPNGGTAPNDADLSVLGPSPALVISNAPPAPPAPTVTAPSNLTLTQTPNWKTFTVNWTAGSGNGGASGCQLQYQNAAGLWKSVASPASFNCDADGNSAANNLGAVTLPGDGWYGANWSSVPLRLMRNSDSSTAATFNTALKCSALPASLTATPNIDENCDNLWDTSGTAVTQTYNNPSGISVPLNPGAHFSVPASYGGCPYVKIQWLKAFENYGGTINGSCGGPASNQWPSTWGSNGWTSPGTPASLVVASGLDSPLGTISFPINGACVGQNATTTQLFGYWDMRALPPYNVWDSYSLVYQCTGTVYY